LGKSGSKIHAWILPLAKILAAEADHEEQQIGISGQQVSVVLAHVEGHYRLFAEAGMLCI